MKAKQAISKTHNKCVSTAHLSPTKHQTLKQLKAAVMNATVANKMFKNTITIKNSRK